MVIIAMEKENIVYGRIYVYNYNYHIVFATKYRRKVLTPKTKRTYPYDSNRKGF
jgi:REP element-mobilizing transposase RayT